MSDLIGVTIGGVLIVATAFVAVFIIGFAAYLIGRVACAGWEVCDRLADVVGDLWWRFRS